MGYRKKIKVAVACLCCTVISVNTLAKSKAERLYQLSLADLSKVEITSATGNSTPLDKAPATASVITSEEIEATGARTLEDVLARVPGLHVSLSMLSRIEPVYAIRGIQGGFNQHVLLLMNGVPVQFALQGGAPVMFRYPVKNIEKVEVIRGPGSAIYGADAYSGVINVITKDIGGSGGTTVGVRAGSFEARDAWLVGSKSLGSWGINYSLEYQHSDGDNQRVVDADLQTIFDTFFGSDASLAPGELSTRYEVTNVHVKVSSDQIIGNVWAWVSRDSGVGAGGAQALDYAGHDDNTLFLNDITYQTDKWLGFITSSFRGSYLYYKNSAEFVLFPPDVTVPIGSDGNIDFSSPNLVTFPDGLKGNPGGVTQDAQIDLVSVFDPWERFRWRVALGLRKQSFDSTETKNFGPGVIDGSDSVVDGRLTDVSDSPFVFVQDVSRTIKYLSLQQEWQIDTNWDLTAGVRFDEYSDFGFTANPRVALVWVANEILTTKLLYGSAFRAPSFSEQSNRNNPVILGNPHLNPEVIDTYEFVANWKINDDVRSSISLFHYKARDMIEYVPDSGATTNTAQNVRNQNGIGAEFEVNWDVKSDFRVTSNLSWQNAKDDNTDQSVPDVPQVQFFMSTDWRYCDFCHMNVQLGWVGERDRASGDPREKIDDYFNVDVALDFQIPNSHFKTSVGVRNLTDEDQREPSDGSVPNDFPLEGRALSLSLSYKF